jgi:SpoU rRNA methylase family enzyme
MKLEQIKDAVEVLSSSKTEIKIGIVSQYSQQHLAFSFRAESYREFVVVLGLCVERFC